MREGLGRLNGRRELLYVALTGAEVCLVACLFLGIAGAQHPPMLLWLGMLVLQLGFFYIYQALVEAYLSLRVQQGLLVAVLLLATGLLLRFHVYGSADLQGSDWLLEPFRFLTEETGVVPRGWLAVLALVYLWARGIHLARRSISLNSVGFSFRLGLVLLVLCAGAVGLFTGVDVSGFVVAFFIFGPLAVALARIEEVSRAPNSSLVGLRGFWVGWTVGGVALLVLVGVVIAALFTGGGLDQVMVWLSPIWLVLWGVFVGLGVLLLMLLEALFAFLAIDLSTLGLGLREVFQRLGEFLFLEPPPTPPVDTSTRPPFLAAMQVLLTIAVPALIVAIVVLITWYRIRKSRREGRDESRESMLSAGVLAQGLQAMLQAGRDRLGELVGMVGQFGLGSRFLSAVSIKRIYANLVRLATNAGYPRLESQTPNEYLETLHEALPSSEADLGLITGAYVEAHYGQVPDSQEELQRIRDAWERVRAEGIKRRKPETD